MTNKAKNIAVEVTLSDSLARIVEIFKVGGQAFDPVLTSYKSSVIEANHSVDTDFSSLFDHDLVGPPDTVTATFTADAIWEVLFDYSEESEVRKFTTTEFVDTFYTPEVIEAQQEAAFTLAVDALTTYKASVTEAGHTVDVIPGFIDSVYKAEVTEAGHQTSVVFF